KHLIKLRDAEQKAKESDALKTAFLQNISHEVRTPMNSIIGFSELVKDERISDEKRAEYLRIINMSSLQLLNVVNSILDISLIETGNLKVSEKKVQLNEVLDEVQSFISPMIKEDVSFSIQKGLPDYEATILTDEQKLKKVIINIVSNAAKFTDKGRITLGYSLNEHLLEFFTEDTGIGIPEDFLRNIFERFRKADGGTRFYEGLGLGLSISKGFLDILGGKLWVVSEKGKGSKFYFTIPYKPVSVPSPQAV
ncbi:MAG TPA: ATP-binding protein, partial [Bacteroidales bacterium]|nr:ATP-binding protein [Bacteroidales bacterium]